MSRATVGCAAVVMGMAAATGLSAQAEPSTLTIDGTSTVRSWTCEANSFTVVPNPPSGFEDGVMQGQESLESVTLTFPVTEIDCGNGKMDDHLRNALKAKDHPRIQYSLSTYDIATAATGVTVKATGDLMIAGAVRPITMDVSVTRDASGAVRVQGKQDVKMTEFGVTPPKLMLGTLKVGDEVTVTFDVTLRASQVGVAAIGARGSNNN